MRLINIDTLSTYFQQRAVHLFVMQQLFSQYCQTIQDFRKYLVQETQNFNRDITNNKNTPPTVSIFFREEYPEI